MPDDPKQLYPVLICVLNMTKSDFSLIKAIARSNIFQFIRFLMKDMQ